MVWTSTVANGHINYCFGIITKREFKIRRCYCVLQAKSDLLLIFILPVSKKNSLCFFLVVSKSSVWEYKIPGSLSLNKVLKHSHVFVAAFSLLVHSWFVETETYVHWVLNIHYLTLAPQYGGPWREMRKNKELARVNLRRISSQELQAWCQVPDAL